jgi:uncharacterized membrane protein YdjX (TVP38/TMEM64 family)
VALALAWKFTGLSAYADPKHIAALLSGLADSVWGPPAAVAGFVLGGLIAFPVLIMIPATAALFGPWLGLACSVAGIAASASLMYAIGARLGGARLGGARLGGQPDKGAMSRPGGARWSRLRAHLQRRGLLAVVALRVLPLAPFSVVNVAAGASGIRLVDFALGTLIGMAPGLVTLCFMGSRIAGLIENPSTGQVLLLAVAVAVWIGVSFAAQAVVSRLTQRSA